MVRFGKIFGAELNESYVFCDYLKQRIQVWIGRTMIALHTIVVGQCTPVYGFKENLQFQTYSYRHRYNFD